MDHLMPPLEGMMKALGTPNITPELKQKVINGVMVRRRLTTANDLREAAGRPVDQLAQEENRVLIGLLKLREETGLNKASAEPMAAA
jgi:carnitine 3-dehydrogenase